MRIVYLTQSYPPMVSGAAIAVERLALGMAERGHHVLVIAASETEYTYQTVNGTLTVLRLGSINNPKRVGQRFLLFPRSAVLKALKEFKPDIVHSHEPSLVLAGLEYANQNRIPSTITVHMLPWFFAAVIPNKWLRVALEKTAWGYMKLLSRRATILITTTRIAARVVTEKLGIRVETIPNGIDTNVLHPHPTLNETSATRTRLNLPLNLPIILHVGRLDTEKNVASVVHASAAVILETGAHLLIVGDGREKPALLELADQYGIADHVHFTGYISMDDGLAEIYRNANLFVLGSEVESQGLVLLEAAASGLPLVAFDTTTISEIVHNEVNGFLVKQGDIHAMSEAMIKIITNPALAANMGAESRKYSSYYDIHHVQSLHEQFYGKLIELQKAANREKHSSWKRVRLWMGLNK